MQTRLVQILGMVSSTYKVVKATCEYVATHPMQALTTVLYLHVGFSAAAGVSKHSPLLAGINQSPLLPYDNVFSGKLGICYPVDEISITHHVITNVPSLNEVNVFLFGENHQSLDHHFLKSHFVTTIGNGAGDLFFEGISLDAKIHCENICMSNDKGELKLHANSKIATRTDPTCTFYFNFSSTLHCMGWEEKGIYHKSSDAVSRREKMLDIVNANDAINNFRDKLTALYEQLKNGLVKLEVIRKSEEILSILIKLYKNEYSEYLTSKVKSEIREIKHLLKNPANLNAEFLIAFFISKGEFFILERQKMINNAGLIINESDNVVLIERNRGIINALEKGAGSKNKKFIFAGAAHLFKKNDFQPITKTDLYKSVEQTDPEWELRKYLEKHPHAILLPRNLKPSDSALKASKSRKLGK